MTVSIKNLFVASAAVASLAGVAGCGKQEVLDGGDKPSASISSGYSAAEKNPGGYLYTECVQKAGVIYVYNSGTSAPATPLLGRDSKPVPCGPTQ